MNPSATHSKRSARGWWSLLTGVLFVFAATLGLGFYLPLQQTYGLLKKELASSQSTAQQLGESLARSEALVQRLTAERSELENFKTQTAAAAQRYPQLAERFAAEADPVSKTALDTRRIAAIPLDAGLGVAWTSSALLNWKRSAPSPSGQKLLCPLVKGAARMGFGNVTVRTFASVDAATPDVQAARSAAAALALSVAQQLTTLCAMPAGTVSVASSPRSNDSPLLQLEFQQAVPAAQVGL
jgi:hypothetical protein